MKHGIADLTSPEFAARADRTKVALIPVGATEQHGANLGMGIDWRVAQALAVRIAERVDPLAVVVPALPVGLSGHHLSFPGTLSVSAATFTALCTDIASSLARHGIRKIVFVNGHRGNESVLGVITTSLTYEAGIEAASAFWMTQASDVIAEYVSSRRWGHACEIETSLTMALCPDLVRADSLEPGETNDDYGAYEDNIAPFALQVPRSFASRTANGVFGDARLATVEAGEAIAGAVVERVAAFVTDFAARPPRRI